MFTTSKWRRYLGAFTVTAWMGLVPVVAQAAKEEVKDAPHPTWALAYVLVILAIAMGLIAICRPGARTDDLKLQANEDD
jgi:hypothetical protein